MLAIERRNEILEKLQIEKRVVVSELSQLYKVSEETIRRDLEKLENEGLAIKSYGGAVLNENTSIDLPFNIRKNHNIVGKQKIASIISGIVHDKASIISRIVHDKETLMLDASSTAVFIAKELKEKKSLSVITNSIEIIMELFGTVDWNVISTGGLVKEGSFAMVGPQTDRMLQCYHVDKAIISCKGLNINEGVSDSDDLHAQNKKTMLDSAHEKILVADNSKFGKIAFVQIGNFENINKVVTDIKPSDEWLEFFSKMDIECIYE